MDSNLPRGIFTNNQDNTESFAEDAGIMMNEEKLNVEQEDEYNVDEDTAQEVRRHKIKYKKLEPKQWMLISLIYMIPFVNIGESIYFMITKNHPETENWGKGAVIPSVIISVIMLFIIIRFKFMGFESYINLYNILH